MTSKVYQEEDVYPVTLVQRDNDYVAWLPHPNGPHLHDKAPDDVEDIKPRFAVTSKGFQFYAETEVYLDHDDPNGEPVFHGSIVRERTHLPRYSIKVKL